MLQAALYLIPVPLSDGPASDVLPQRNIAIVSEIRHFIVENVRSARRFLKKCNRNIDIDALAFSTLDEHTRPEEVGAMLQPLRQGEAVGVISEAGCPAIADPGADAVAIAQREGLKVIPLVGPSSILMSLMASGFNGQSFAFIGYLPIEPQQRQRKLHNMVQCINSLDQTQIFIETPYRNNRLMAEMVKSLPPRLRLCVASNITGLDETIITRTIGEWEHAKYDFDKIPTIFLLYK